MTEYLKTSEGLDFQDSYAPSPGRRAILTTAAAQIASVFLAP